MFLDLLLEFPAHFAGKVRTHSIGTGCSYQVWYDMNSSYSYECTQMIYVSVTRNNNNGFFNSIWLLYDEPLAFNISPVTIELALS